MLKPTHALQMIQFRRPRHDQKFCTSLSPALVLSHEEPFGKNVLVPADILNLDAKDLKMMGHYICTGGCGRHSCCGAVNSTCAHVGHCTECDTSYCDECRILRHLRNGLLHRLQDEYVVRDLQEVLLYVLQDGLVVRDLQQGVLHRLQDEYVVRHLQQIFLR